MKFLMILAAALTSLLGTMVNAGFCATYYVAANGSDNNPGTLEKPWATFTHANSLIDSGDTVIARGGTYREFWKIDKPNTIWQAYPGETPLVDGQFEIPYPDKAGDLTPMIAITENGVILNGFHIYRSAGNGISVYNYRDTGVSDVTIRNCKVDWTYQLNILVYRAHNILVEDCEFSRAAYVVDIKCHFDIAACRTPGSTTGLWYDNPAIDLPGSSQVVFRRCTVRDSYNEGFNVGRYGCSDNTIEYSQIYGNRKTNLYISNCNNVTVRYNLVYGMAYNASGLAADSTGIELGNETQFKEPACGGHKIYGNLVANAKTLLYVGGQGPDALVQNTAIYNNTFLYPRKDWNIIYSEYNGNNHLFMNNIVIGSGYYGLIYKSPKAPFINSDYNLWSSKPFYADFCGKHDFPYGVPSFVRSNDWQSLYSGALNGQEFAFKEINSGLIAPSLTLNSEKYNQFVSCSDSNWKTGKFKLVESSAGSPVGACADPSTGYAPTLLPPSDLSM